MYAQFLISITKEIKIMIILYKKDVHYYENPIILAFIED
jgi:hypothetical protein